MWRFQAYAAAVVAGLGFGGDFAFAQESADEPPRATQNIPRPPTRDARQAARQRDRQELLEKTDAMVEALQAEVARVSAQLEELQEDLRELQAMRAVLHRVARRAKEPELRRAEGQPAAEPKVPAPRPSTTEAAPPPEVPALPDEPRPPSERVELPRATEVGSGAPALPPTEVDSGPPALPPSLRDEQPAQPAEGGAEKPEMPEDPEDEPDMGRLPPIPPWPGDEAIRAARGQNESQTDDMAAKSHLIKVGDSLQVEVLEALTGRPISGFRRVRSDGTISLGFYGDLKVAGLTRRQAKSKLVLRLREFITDEYLGLILWDAEKKRWKHIATDETDRVFVDDEPLLQEEGSGPIPIPGAAVETRYVLPQLDGPPSLETRLGKVEEKLDRVIDHLLQARPAAPPSKP
jgi:hypothetical protein